MDCRTKFYSSAVFSLKGDSFHCKIIFSGVFRIFRDLFELDLLL